MPIFEYQCDKCRERFDFLARTRQEKPEQCPKCGAIELTKQFASFAAVSSGSSSGPACSNGACNLPSSACSTGSCPFV